MLVLNNATTLPYWPDFMTSLPAIHTLSNPKKYICKPNYKLLLQKNSENIYNVGQHFVIFYNQCVSPSEVLQPEFTYITI